MTEAIGDPTQPTSPSDAREPAPGETPPGKRRRRGRRGGRNRRNRQPATAGATEAPLYAAIDLGTNNCRLLVARETADGFEVVDAFSRIVRLGEGLQPDSRLSEAAMRRTISALRVCSRKIERDGVAQVRAVATQACRDALNCNRFRKRIRANTGLTLEIISPEEEARLALAGSAPLLSTTTPYGLVFDIGGGSTEIMWLTFERDNRPRLVATLSLPLGVASLSAAYGCDSFSPQAYESMVEQTAAWLAPFERQWGIAERIRQGNVQMLGTSGTVTTVAGIQKGLKRYNRVWVDGSELSFPDIEQIATGLARMDREERASHPCIGYQRCDFVVPGCAILEAICRTWPVGRLRVADRGVREGILFEMMRQGISPKPLASSA